MIGNLVEINDPKILESLRNNNWFFSKNVIATIFTGLIVYWVYFLKFIAVQKEFFI